MKSKKQARKSKYEQKKNVKGFSVVVFDLKVLKVQNSLHEWCFSVLLKPFKHLSTIKVKFQLRQRPKNYQVLIFQEPNGLL